MTRVLTIADLLWLLLWLCGQLLSAMGRNRHNMLGWLLFLSVVMLALSVFLSYRCVKISQLRNPYLLDQLSQQSLHLYDQLAQSQSHPGPGYAPVLLPQSQRPALTVHYMWCRKGVLEFKHYLALLSVAKVLKPDQIVFHYLKLPQPDPKGYFTWFHDIQRDVAMLTLKPITDSHLCGHSFSRGVPKSQDFPNNDGVFMTEDVAVAKLSREDFYALTHARRLFGCKKKKRSANEGEVEEEVCKGAQEDRPPAQLFLVPSSEPYDLVGAKGRGIIDCPTIDEYNKPSRSSSATAASSPISSPACVQVSQRLFPSDIWLRNNTFNRLARWVAYSQQEPVRPEPRPDRAAPNVAHILKKDDSGDLTPACYASVLSAFSQGQMTHVFLHGHLQSQSKVDCPMWRQLKDKFPLTHIPTPSLHAGSDSRRWWLYGTQVLLQYGGVLLTCDTLVQKPLQPLLQYPAVWAVQKSQYRIVHHTMDLGVMVAAPSSTYLQSMVPVLRQMVEVGGEGAVGRDAGAVAYHLYERSPSSLHLHLHLLAHLSCHHLTCVPSPGQLDVRQAYTVQLSWAQGSDPPSTWQQWSQLSTPLRLPSALLENPHDAAGAGVPS